jgi:hypothetical protein
MDPHLDLGGRYSCRAAAATRSVSIAVRAAHLNYRRQSHTDDAARFVRGSPPELGARKSADIEIIVMGAAIFAIAWAVLNPKTSAQVIVAVLGVVSLSNQSL